MKRLLIAMSILSLTISGAAQQVPSLLSLFGGFRGILNSRTYVAAEQLGVCDASAFPGGDAGSKINAAEAELNCAVVDATNFSSPTAAETVQATKPLMLGSYTFLVSGNPGINIGNHSCLLGRGRQSTIISTTSATADVIYTNPGNNWSCAQGFTIQASVPRTAGAGMHIQAGHGVFRDILINPVWDGIKLDRARTADANYFDNIYMTGGGAGAAWRCGILNGGVSEGTVSGNTFHNIDITADPTTFDDAMLCIQDGSDGISFSDSQFVKGHGDSVALHLERVRGGDPPEWIKCTNCYFEGGPTANGVVVDSSLTFDCMNCYVGSSLNGVVLHAGTGFHWDGGQIVNNQQHGVHIAGSINTQFTNTRFADNSQAANSTYDDILVDANVNNFTIISNTFASFANPPNKPKWNIEIAPGASINYYIIGNIMPGSAATGSLIDNPASTRKTVQTSEVFNIDAASLQMKGNILKAPARSGTLALISGTQTFFVACSGKARPSSKLWLQWVPGNCASSSNRVLMPMPSPGRIRNLHVRCATGGANRSSGLFTIQKNGLDQAVNCLMGIGSQCHDTRHSFSVAAGDSLQIAFTTQPSETLANCAVTFEKQ